MMGTKAAVANDMMMKLKESSSLKSFSSKRYHSSLICKSKTIRMNMNLIDQNNVTSAGGFSGSKFNILSSRNVPENNPEASIWHEKNLENLVIINKSAESSSVLEHPPKSGNKAELLKTGDPPKSFTESEKSKLESSVKHLYQDNSQGPSNQNQNKEDFNYKHFRCDVCMKYYSSQRGVKRHSILHSLERHSCEKCGKVFSTREDLEKHHKAIHEVDERKIRCSKCNKAYFTKYGLTRHLKRYPDHVQLKIKSLPTDLLLDVND